MAFQIKNFISIVASMINHARGATTKITDFNVGSVARTMFESPAVEIDELYQQMFNGLKEAIPAAIYPPFGFEKLTAAYAYTTVTFTHAPAPATPIVIPAGTQVRIPGTETVYTTQAEAQIPTTATQVSVRVVCATAGTAGNTAADTITELVNPVTGVTVTNPAAIINGRNQETDDERKLRFIDYVRSLARSHLDGIQYGAKTAVVTDANGVPTEQAVQALAIEPWVSDPTKPLGRIDCYIWNGVDSASPTLVANAQQIIDGYETSGVRVPGYKAAGIICTAHPCIEQYQDVTVTGVQPMAGYTLADLAPLIDQAAQDYIRGLPLGSTEIVRNEMIRVIKSITGLYDFTLAVPAADVAVAANAKALPGAITVS